MYKMLYIYNISIFNHYIQYKIIHALLHFIVLYLDYMDFLGCLILLFIAQNIGSGPSIPPKVDSAGQLLASYFGDTSV